MFFCSVSANKHEPNTEVFVMTKLVQKTIPLPYDLSGQARGLINVLFDQRPPRPSYSLGSFIILDKQLYEVVLMYRLASEPSIWHYVLEPRKTLLCAEPNDLWGMIYVSCCVGQHIPRHPEFLFMKVEDAATFFIDIPEITERRTVSGSELRDHAEIISSGEVVDDLIIARRQAIANLAFEHQDILGQVLSGMISLDDALEQLEALNLAAADIASDEDLPDDLRAVIGNINAFLRDTDPDGSR